MRRYPISLGQSGVGRHVFILAALLAAFVGLCLWEHANNAKASPPAGTATVALYGAGYVTDADKPPADEDRLAKLEAKVDRILKLLESLLDDKDAPVPAAQVGDPLSSGASKCATCHAPDTAKKGGDFVLFDAKADGLHFKVLNARGVQKVVRELSDATMPPKDATIKLTDPERQALIKTFQPPKGGQ